MSTAIKAKEETSMEYTPFQADQSIKLSVGIVQNLLCVPTKSGQKCSANEALKFMMMCRSGRLDPFQRDAYLIGYDSKDGPTFSLITSHQAFLKRAEVHPEFDGMSAGVIVEDGNGDIVDREGDFTFEADKLLGAWATVHFKTRAFPMKKRVNLRTFKKNYGRWQEDAAGMIVKCAEADALRSSFPTMLGGMYLDDEMPAPTMPDTTNLMPFKPGPPTAPASRSAALAQFLATEPDTKDHVELATAQPSDSAHELPSTPPAAGPANKQDILNKLEMAVGEEQVRNLYDMWCGPDSTLQSQELIDFAGNACRKRMDSTAPRWKT